MAQLERETPISRSRGFQSGWRLMAAGRIVDESPRHVVMGRAPMSGRF